MSAVPDGKQTTWSRLIHAWPVIVVVTSFTWVIILLAFNTAVDDRVEAIIETHPVVIELKAEVARVKLEMDLTFKNNKETVNKIEVKMNSIDTKLDGLILLLQQRAVNGG